MTVFAEYLLKVMICSGVLTGYYWLALRNKLFHSWNRFYLLASVVVALLLPFLKISFIAEPQPENLSAYTILQTVTTTDVWFSEKATAPEAKTFTKEQISLFVYSLISLLLTITFIITLLRIKKLIAVYEHWKMKDLTFVDTDAKGTPFSFLHYIFWNREIDFESAQGQQIFKHELIHVKEKHSLDKLFLQLVLIVFWINPFFWIIRKELTMIHEFIADRKSVKDSDASALAAMILTSAFPGQTLSLTNPFFYSPIKRRLLMLSKLQNPKVGYISRLLLLPLLTFLFTAFALKIKENDAASSIPRLEKSLTVVIDAGHGFIDGKRHGSVGLNGISEDELALAITKKIEILNTDPNLKLVFTRKDENYVEREERAKITKENNADLFISIHANYVPKLREEGKEFENPANGFEVYITKDNNVNFTPSKELGSAIITEFKNFMAIRQPGIKQRTRGIWVLDTISCPAVVLECGFISNSKDVAFLSNEKNQEKIAEAVLKGIVNYSKRNGESPAQNLEEIRITTDTIPQKEPNKVFVKAEVMPEFPGGENKWKQYIGKVVKDNISTLVTDGKEGTCEVKFIVHTDGTVSDITVKTMTGTSLAKMAVKAISQGPKWVPAIQNSKRVKCWSTQKITFRLAPKNDIQAISIANAYMQNLFIGIDNPLVMSIGNTPGSQLQVTTNNGTVTKVNGTWVARPSFEGKATITITDPKTNQEGKAIFTVKQLAVPVITLGNSKGGRISADKITESKQLMIDEDWEKNKLHNVFYRQRFP
jgi:N-acetylmuramoyl-L-alanine amidase